MLKRDPTKPSRCRICRSEYVKRNMTHKVCSPACAQALALAVRNKAERKAAAAERVKDRATREKLKRKPDLTKEAQRAFNSFIRERDRQAGHPCISSGRPLDWSGNGVDAGHYRSTGSAPQLRFDERNCHAQSKQDNRYGAGAAVEYRIGLIARIGLAEVEDLESTNAVHHWEHDELRAIRDKYKAKLKQLQREHP